MPVLGRCAARLYRISLHSHASCVDSAWSSDLRLGDDDVSFFFLQKTTHSQMVVAVGLVVCVLLLFMPFSHDVACDNETVKLDSLL